MVGNASCLYWIKGGREGENKWERFILQTSWKVIPGLENYPDLPNVLPLCRDKITRLHMPTSVRVQWPCQFTEDFCIHDTRKTCDGWTGSENTWGHLHFWILNAPKWAGRYHSSQAGGLYLGFVIINLDGGGGEVHLYFSLTSHWNLACPSIYGCRQQTAVESAVPETLSLIQSKTFSYHIMPVVDITK